MKPSLLNFLVCPACAGELSLEAWLGTEAHVEEGTLRCRCGEMFPIIGGVPRMLLGDFRAQLRQDYSAFFDDHAGRLSHGAQPTAVPTKAAHTALLNTQHSFGFEWTAFSSMRPEWERNYWGYLTPLTPEALSGKLVLDAGCGMGRHLYHTARHAGEVIGVDLSKAVDVAQKYLRDSPRGHVVQANLMQLPFRHNTFDFIYCLGVLHHLPDSEAALHRLLRHLKPTGDLRIYVYWSLADGPLWTRALLGCVNGLRRLTTCLPHRLLLWCCYPIAACSWLFLVLPYQVLSRFPATRGWAEQLPLRQYADYPFGVLVNDQFDRLSAPIEKRYTPQQVRDWLQNAGLDDVQVLPYSGWLGHGRKPEAVGQLAGLSPMTQPKC